MNTMRMYTWILGGCIHEYNENTMRMYTWKGERMDGCEDESVKVYMDKHGSVKGYMVKNMEGWKDIWLRTWKGERIYG